MQTPISGEKGMGSVVQCKQIGILLGLMMRHVCESSDFIVFSSPSQTQQCWERVSLEGDNILQLMQDVEGVASTLGGGTDFPYDFIEKAMANKVHYDFMFIFSDMMISPGNSNMSNSTSGRNWTVESILRTYREQVNPNMRFVSIDLAGHGAKLGAELEDDSKNILITGYSDSILRLVTELQGSQIEAIKEASKNLIKT